MPESLDSFGLSRAVTGLVAWAAPNAEQVETDVAQVLSRDHAAGARARQQAALTRALAALDAQRSKVYGPHRHGDPRARPCTRPPPRLPG